LKERPPYERLEALTRTLCDGLATAAAGVPHVINRVGSMWTLFFAPGPVTDFDGARASDVGRFARFFWAMMDRGVYLPCSQFEAAFMSNAHTDDDVARTAAAARESLR
jgi:glutamate-1-semialdehyde 2,1-aminomutase